MTRDRRGPIALANDQVSIGKACQLIGMDLPEGFEYGRSLKTYCPFGEVYHSDQGAEPAFRIYPDSNSAWCFACSTYFSPVSLVAAAWDMDRKTAAIELLERTGYAPLTPQQLWSNVSTYTPAPDATLLAEALKTFCARIHPDWDRLQFTADVAGMLTRCLSLLDLVRTDHDATQWLETCKKAMSAILAESRTR